MQGVRVILVGLATVVWVSAGLTACGDGSSDSSEGLVVVSTSILGDIVENVVGDAAEVEVILGAGTDPHEAAPSARQATRMREADALVVNGLGFEEGLADAIDGTEDAGVPVFVAADALRDQPDGLELLPLSEADHADATEDHGGLDPHVFGDPVRMATVVDDLGAFLAEHVEGFDPATATNYAKRLEELDLAIRTELDAIPDRRRVLVTNHDVLGYFADRYGFGIVGVVLQGGTTLAGSSAEHLVELAEVITEHDVPAIFVDSSAPSRVAESLARETGRRIEVVELYTESLGPSDSGADTYIGLLQTNAERIARALRG